MRTAVYPGTFDPVTNGHLDLVTRASQIFDKIIIAVSNNPHKNPLFSMEERKDLIEQIVKGRKNIEVDLFDGLLVEYAKSKGACAIIRGLRAVSDFEYEFQMALINKKLYPDLETVLIMSSSEFVFLSSSLVREIAFLDGDVSKFVPSCVEKRLKGRSVNNGR